MDDHGGCTAGDRVLHDQPDCVGYVGDLEVAYHLGHLRQPGYHLRALREDQWPIDLDGVDDVPDGFGDGQCLLPIRLV